MRFTILSDVPGRMRVHLFHGKLDPDCRLELRRWLHAHDGLESVSFSTRTGNLLVNYAPEMPREKLLALLGGLRLFEVATVGEYGSETSVVRSVKKVCHREALALLRKAILPDPVNRVLMGWKMGTGLYRVFEALFNGELERFFWGAARFVAMAVFGGSLVTRMLCRVLSDLTMPLVPGGEAEPDGAELVGAPVREAAEAFPLLAGAGGGAGFAAG